MPTFFTSKAFKIAIIILLSLSFLWVTASYYLYTQAVKIVYEPQYSKDLVYKVETTTEFTNNSAGEKLDLLFTKKADSDKYFLYLSGNVGRLPYIVEGLSEYQNLLSVAYPGYSLSQGAPNTDKVNEAAEIALKYLNDKGITNDKITVFGHSLGGSPSLYLASKHADLNKVIIVNTFYSMQKMCEIEYSILCVFASSIHPSNTYAKQAKAPIIHYHNPKDEKIPFAQGQELNKIIASQNSFYEISGTHGEFPVDEALRY